MKQHQKHEELIDIKSKTDRSDSAKNTISSGKSLHGTIRGEFRHRTIRRREQESPAAGRAGVKRTSKFGFTNCNRTCAALPATAQLWQPFLTVAEFVRVPTSKRVGTLASSAAAEWRL